MNFIKESTVQYNDCLLFYSYSSHLNGPLCAFINVAISVTCAVTNWNCVCFQMLISISFNQPVKLHSLKLFAPDDGNVFIKLFVIGIQCVQSLT